MTDAAGNLLCNALNIATEAHSGQFRNDGLTPYIQHPIAVMKILLSQYKHLCSHEWPLEVYQSAALLHDVLEDCPGYTDQILLDRLEVGSKSVWAEVVVHAVNCLTKDPLAFYLTNVLKAAGNPISRVVKIADIHHNSLDLHPAKDKNRLEKYKLATYILKNYNEQQD